MLIMETLAYNCYREQRVTGICIHTLIGLSTLLTAMLRVSTFMLTRVIRPLNAFVLQLNRTPTMSMGVTLI